MTDSEIISAIANSSIAFYGVRKAQRYAAVRIPTETLEEIQRRSRELRGVEDGS
jgi:hypothetical protein